MIIYDKAGELIDHTKIEPTEQELVREFVKKDDVVLELGARYGSSSIILNKIIEGKNIVCVEPDGSVWDSLEKNRQINNCDFNVVKGAISKDKLNISFNDYATYTFNDDNGDINIYDLWELQEKFNLKFNVLVADCEGCLSVFIEHYEEFFKQLRLVIFEADGSSICDYKIIFGILYGNGFKSVKSGFHNVFLKN